MSFLNRNIKDTLDFFIGTGLIILGARDFFYSGDVGFGVAGMFVGCIICCLVVFDMRNDSNE